MLGERAEAQMVVVELDDRKTALCNLYLHQKNHEPNLDPLVAHCMNYRTHDGSPAIDMCV